MSDQNANHIQTRDAAVKALLVTLASVRGETLDAVIKEALKRGAQSMIEESWDKLQEAAR